MVICAKSKECPWASACTHGSEHEKGARCPPRDCRVGGKTECVEVENGDK